MPYFDLGFAGQFHTAAAAARDRGWVVVQLQDFNWYLRAADDSQLATVIEFMNSYDTMAFERNIVRQRIVEETRRQLDKLGTVNEKIALIARSVAMLDRKGFRPWTPLEEAQADRFRRELAKIDAIYAAKTQIETDIMGFTESEPLLAFDPASSPRWQEKLAEAAAGVDQLSAVSS